MCGCGCEREGEERGRGRRGEEEEREGGEGGDFILGYGLNPRAGIRTFNITAFLIYICIGGPEPQSLCY